MNFFQASGAGVLAAKLAFAVPPAARRDHGGHALVHSGGVDRHRRTEAVADDADPVGIDLRLARKPGQGVASVRDLIQAQDVSALSAAVAAAAHVEAKRGIAEVAQHSRLDLGVRLVLRAHEAVQHEKCRKLSTGVALVGDVQDPGELEIIGLESNGTFHGGSPH